jgi:hypothetical protein
MLIYKGASLSLQIKTSPNDLWPDSLRPLGVCQPSMDQADDVEIIN